MTELGEEQKEYLDYIQSSSESLLAIINDVLDLSKIEAGRIWAQSTADSGSTFHIEVPFFTAEGLMGHGTTT